MNCKCNWEMWGYEAGQEQAAGTGVLLGPQPAGEKGVAVKTVPPWLLTQGQWAPQV